MLAAGIAAKARRARGVGRADRGHDVQVLPVRPALARRAVSRRRPLSAWRCRWRWSRWRCRSTCSSRRRRPRDRPAPAAGRSHGDRAAGRWRSARRVRAASLPVRTAARSRGAGPQRLDIDVAVARGRTAVRRSSQHGDRPIARGGLSDLRLFSAGERRDPVPAGRSAACRHAGLRDGHGRCRSPPTKETSGFEADLGAARWSTPSSIGGIPGAVSQTLHARGQRRPRAVDAARSPKARPSTCPPSSLRHTQIEFRAG